MNKNANVKIGDMVIVNNKGKYISHAVFAAANGKVFKVINLYHLVNPGKGYERTYSGTVMVEGYNEWIGDDCYSIIEEDDKVVDVERKPKWKDGDTLICIDKGDRRHLTTGNLYQIVAFNINTVLVKDDKGLNTNYVVGRFKKATPAIIKRIEAQVKKEAEIARLAKEEAEKIEAIEEAKKIALAKSSGFYGLRDKLEEISAKGANHTSLYGIQYADGTMKLNPNQACHASISGYGNEGRIALAENLSCQYRKVTNINKSFGEKYKRWISYVCGEGPRRDCFVWQGVDSALKYGLLYNTNRPINEIIGAANQLREGSEFCKDRLPLFCELLDEGFSGNVAYLLSYCVNTELDFVDFCNSHKSLIAKQNAEELLKFFREGYSKTKNQKPYNKSNNNYEGIYRWAAEATMDNSKTISKFFQEGLKMGKQAGDGWDVKIDKVDKKNLLAFAIQLEPLVNNF